MLEGQPGHHPLGCLSIIAAQIHDDETFVLHSHLLRTHKTVAGLYLVTGIESYHGFILNLDKKFDSGSMVFLNSSLPHYISNNRFALIMVGSDSLHMRTQVINITIESLTPLNLPELAKRTVIKFSNFTKSELLEKIKLRDMPMMGPLSNLKDSNSGLRLRDKFLLSSLL